jgi:hypothetical protein
MYLDGGSCGPIESTDYPYARLQGWGKPQPNNLSPDIRKSVLFTTMYFLKSPQSLRHNAALTFSVKKEVGNKEE